MIRARATCQITTKYTLPNTSEFTKKTIKSRKSKRNNRNIVMLQNNVHKICKIPNKQLFDIMRSMVNMHNKTAVLTRFHLTKSRIYFTKYVKNAQNPLYLRFFRVSGV